ncbi:MAG: hypothetical protein WD342_04315 [Verrucomicrobiales bacterium]
MIERALARCFSTFAFTSSALKGGCEAAAALRLRIRSLRAGDGPRTGVLNCLLISLDCSAFAFDRQAGRIRSGIGRRGLRRRGFGGSLRFPIPLESRFDLREHVGPVLFEQRVERTGRPSHVRKHFGPAFLGRSEDSSRRGAVADVRRVFDRVEGDGVLSGVHFGANDFELQEPSLVGGIAAIHGNLDGITVFCGPIRVHCHSPGRKT